MRNELGGFKLLRFSDCCHSPAIHLAYPDRSLVHLSPSCSLRSYVDPKHRQQGARERKELHFQSASQVLRVVLGVIPKASVGHPPSSRVRRAGTPSTGLRKQAWRRLSARAGSPGFHCKAHSLHYSSCLSLKCLLRSLWENLLDLKKYNNLY